MSASNKKKLRKEQNADKLTARQSQAEKEAKQLKRYTVTFVSIIAIILVAAIAIVGVRAVIQSGSLQRNSIAAVVGDKELSAVELSYYYHDVIQQNYSEWYNQYGSSTTLYLQLLMGLDITAPLDKQVYDTKTGQTWASYFVDLALNSAKRTYVLGKLAKEANFELSEDAKKSVDSQIATMQFWAAYNGYNNVDKYLGLSYCFGATVDSYRTYLEETALANAYMEHYTDSLTYTDEQIREFEAEKLLDYNSYSYATCYLSYTHFLGEGTKDDKGNVTYTEEEREAARAKAKEVAESLLGNKNFEELEMAVKALEINKDKTNVSATNNKNILGSKLPALLKDWITNADRKDADSTVIVNEYTPTTDEEEETDDEKTDDKTDTEEDKKEEETVINGFYVVVFTGSNDNKVPTVDVHHLLKAFEGGKKGDDGKMTYTDAEKAKAKEEAEKLLKEWEEMEGGKTLENFKKLVEKNTDDTASAATGGLYENISYDQSYVEPFLNWCIDENRKVGDVEIVETEYGYHIMYFAERNEMIYRDLLITNDMRTKDVEKWYEEQLKTADAATKDLTWIALDTVISG